MQSTMGVITMDQLPCFHCNQVDGVAVRNAIVRVSSFPISPDDATLHDDFETKPKIKNFHKLIFFHFNTKSF